MTEKLKKIWLFTFLKDWETQAESLKPFLAPCKGRKTVIFVRPS
jgi:hypothetical protein